MSIQETQDPLEIFSSWFELAREKEGIEDATAMALSTVDSDGNPDVRMVLMKEFDSRGFTFYTNLNSIKSKQLQENPKAALCFFWEPLERQVRISGSVERVSDEEADAYFNSRPRESRIGAWASKQSTPLEDRFALEKRVALFTAKYAVGSIPRPEFWSGFRIVPRRIEFWIKKPFRLHERLVYLRQKADDPWRTERLYP